MTWTGSNPPLTVASVHPGSERRLDLVHVDSPAGGDVASPRTSATAVPLRLDFTPMPNGGLDIVDAGVYEISIEVRARNADAACYTIRLAWDGTWAGKTETTDPLRVEQPQKVR